MSPRSYAVLFCVFLAYRTWMISLLDNYEHRGPKAPPGVGTPAALADE
eukprot:gene11142-487_t